MSKLHFLIISLIVFVLVSGCASIGTRQVDRRPTAPMGPFLTIATVVPTHTPVSDEALRAVLARPETYCIGSAGYVEWREGRPVSGVYCAVP